MARAVTIGNGNLLVGIDYRGQIRDFYFPQVGLQNHVSGASGSYVHRVGIFVDGELAWLDSSEWEVEVGCDPKKVVGSLRAHHPRLQVTLSSIDAVHNEENVLMRSFSILNHHTEAREVTLFLSQQFRISESRRGDTAFYDPRVGAIIHYKNDIKFLINLTHDNKQFSDYSIGLFDIEGRAGTYHDAEDGRLERNPIEHGSVDSVIGMKVMIAATESENLMYWIACAHTIDDVHALHQHVLDETPQVLIKSTQNYWQAWISKDNRDFSVLSEKLIQLYHRSLTTIRIHADNGGGIIASSDTDMLHHGRDTYSYVWPRDAAIIAHSLDRAGYHDVAKRAFKFLTDRLEKGGYLMHKYSVDGKLGSSWHPWVMNQEPILPIQEDETALTLYHLWNHYELEKDLEFAESLYNPFVEPATAFLCSYLEPVLGLPDNSYDLWEEKYGISTYTASAVYGALQASASFATLLGKQSAAREAVSVAQLIRSNILEHLYDEELGMFVKLVREPKVGETEYDRTIDSSSFFGPIYFGVIDPDDERVKVAAETVERTLRVRSESQGYVRYENDSYYRMHDASSPNPWVITTLWMAQYHIMKAKTLADLKPAYEILEWTESHATTSGVLAEQMHPKTRQHLSTAPLIWSHAEFVVTVEDYTKKYRELSH